MNVLYVLSINFVRISKGKCWRGVENNEVELMREVEIKGAKSQAAGERGECLEKIKLNEQGQ